MAWGRSASGASCPAMTTPLTWTWRGMVGCLALMQDVVEALQLQGHLRDGARQKGFIARHPVTPGDLSNSHGGEQSAVLNGK